MPLKLDYDRLVSVICLELPFEVRLEKKIGERRTVPEEFTDTFGPFATEWDRSRRTGIFFEDRRWDYYQTYRFKDENDAILFKLMAGGQK